MVFEAQDRAICHQTSMLASPNSTSNQYLLVVNPYAQQLIQLIVFSF